MFQRIRPGIITVLQVDPLKQPYLSNENQPYFYIFHVFIGNTGGPDPGTEIYC
jgi:hypothetical protein